MRSYQQIYYFNYVVHSFLVILVMPTNENESVDALIVQSVSELCGS